jgi:hypothetical protein
MATIKRLNTDYVINTLSNAQANITLATNTVFVTGNLVVGGNSTSVTKTEVAVSDNIIALNTGDPGPGVTLGYSGIEVNRGSLANVSLLWSEPDLRWTITNDGVNFGNILTDISSFRIIHDDQPQLGGNLDVLSRNIFSSNTDYVRFDDNLAIQHTTISPSDMPGYTVLYANVPASGGTGLYVVNSSEPVSTELSSARRALIYALLLN